MTVQTPTAIAGLRIAAGYRSATLAAETLGCSRVYLLQIEVGRATPSRALLELMAKTYDITPEKLEETIRATRHEFTKRLLERMGEKTSPIDEG